MWPTNPAELGFALFGALMGAVASLSGWSTSAKITDLKDNPRVKNIMWAFSSVILVVVADLKFLFDDASVNRGRIVVFYMIFMVVATIITIAVNAISVSWRAKSFEAGQDYLHRGYDYYKEKYPSNNNREVVDLFVKLSASHSRTLLTTMKAVWNYLEKPSENHRAQIIETILSDIYAVTVVHLGHDNGINVNYMVSKRYDDCSAEEKGWVRFSPEGSKPDHVLIIEGYARDHGREDRFALPVDRGKFLLPGAPKAYSTRSLQVVNCRKLTVPKGFPKPTQTKMSEHLREKAFKSFISLCIPCDYVMAGVKVRAGVINIECGEEDFFKNLDEDRQKAMIGTIEAFALLLGKVIERSMAQERT